MKRTIVRNQYDHLSYVMTIVDVGYDAKCCVHEMRDPTQRTEFVVTGMARRRAWQAFNKRALFGFAQQKEAA